MTFQMLVLICSNAACVNVSDFSVRTCFGLFDHGYLTRVVALVLWYVHCMPPWNIILNHSTR